MRMSYLADLKFVFERAVVGHLNLKPKAIDAACSGLIPGLPFA